MLESWLDMFGKGFPPSPCMLVSLVLQQTERQQRVSPGLFSAAPEPGEPPVKKFRRETEIRHTIGKFFLASVIRLPRFQQRMRNAAHLVEWRSSLIDLNHALERQCGNVRIVAHSRSWRNRNSRPYRIIMRGSWRAISLDRAIAKFGTPLAIFAIVLQTIQKFL